LWTSAKISCCQHIFTWFLCFTCCCQVLLFCSKLKDKSTLPKSQVIKIFHKMVSLFHMLLTSLAFLSIRKIFRYFRKLSVSAVIKKNRFTWFSSTSKQKRWNSIAQNSEWRISFYGLKNIHLLRPKVKYRYVYPTSPPRHPVQLVRYGTVRGSDAKPYYSTFFLYRMSRASVPAPRTLSVLSVEANKH
jgi:hypothetical protein